MKKLLSKCMLFSALLLASMYTHSQNGKVWVTIANEADVPYFNSNRVLVSDDSAFNQQIQSLQIFSSVKALPAAQTPALQKVYELECNCTLSQLQGTLMSEVSAISGVYPSPVYDTLHTPNDYSLSVGVNNYALNLINAQQAWDITTGDSNVVIAISDQDYSANHPELIGKYVQIYQGGATPTHGNAVAILAAGNTNNNIGLSSIGYNCKLGLYTMNYNEVLIAAYAGYKVINMSWSSGCFYNPYEQLCVTEAFNAGAFLVAAAGNGITCNGAWNYVYPAAYDHVFAVTSIGQNDNHIQYGNDTTATHQHHNKVDLSAPGYDVAIYPINNWILNSSGTSYAAPQVSGTVGLMLSVNPCLSRIDIDTILKLSSVNIDALNPQFAGKIGAGRLNAFAAVQMAQNWNTQPMLVTSQPATAYCLPGGNATFTAASTSTLPLYQWQYDSSGIFVNLINNATYSGVKTATLTITNAGIALNNELYRCVMSSGYCQVITNTASLIISNNIVLPDSAGAIITPAQPCLGDTIQISIAPVNNATGYNWSVTGNSLIISGQNSTTVEIVIYDTACTISVTPVNTYGSGTAASVGISTGPIATASFAGGATICSGNSATLTLNLTGNAPWSGWINGIIPFSTTTSPATITVSPSVTTDYILTELNAGYCPGFPDYFSTMATVTVQEASYDTVQLTVCSNQLPFNWQGQLISNNGIYNDTIVNTSGCDSIITLQLTVAPGNVPLAPSFLTQTLVSNTCNARVYRYTAAITTNATGYQWTIPASCGGIGPVWVDSGDVNSSRIIRLKYFSNAAAFITDSIRVQAYNNCGFGPQRSAKLINQVLNPPAKPISITVTPLVTNLCGERKYRYSAPALPLAGTSTAAATGYLWSFTTPTPLQAVIDSGNSSSAVIVVKYLSNSASLSTDSIFLQYSSACGYSATRGLRISLPALSTPAAPGGITITTLNSNTCGNRKYRLTMPVYPTVSPNQIQPNGYQWTLTGNVATYGVIDSGSLTSRVVVIRFTSDQNTIIGDSIKAQYNSNCGLGAVRAVKFSVTKLIPPATPGYITITAVQPSVCGNRIYRYSAPGLPTGSSSYAPATGYTWEFTGPLGSNALIDSGTVNSKTIRVRYTSNVGAFVGDSVKVRFASSCGFSNYKTVKLTNSLLNGCPPLTGKMMENKKVAFNATIYPNPSNGIINLQLTGNDMPVDIQLLDGTGRCIKQVLQQTGNKIQWREKLPSGIYWITITDQNQSLTQKLIIQ